MVVALLAAISVQAADPILTAFQAQYKTGKANFIGAAEAMPEENYEFKLTPVQRSFGDWIAHTAMLNYNSCSAIAGKAAPENKAMAAKTKAEVKAVIAASFAYCDEVLGAVSEASLLQEVQIGSRKVVPVNVMFSYVHNLGSHYGNVVGYLRSKGITPPSTARAQAQKK